MVEESNSNKASEGGHAAEPAAGDVLGQALQRVAELEAELAKAETKAKENMDLALRVKADAENVRRRSEKEVENAHRYGLEKLVSELLPILDSMELGLAASSNGSGQIATFREGSELTLKMFATALTKFGVKPVAPLGEKFNPAMHQAITMQEKADVEPNTVVAVVQKGYSLADRLVRPAMVIVSKAATTPPPAAKLDEMA